MALLRGQPKRFAFGAMMGGLGIIAGLHLLNPDDVIVSVNVAHDAGTPHFDTAYALSLSADSVPALLNRLDTLLPFQQAVIAKGLLAKYGGVDGWDWRAWNASRAIARSRVAEVRPMLERLAGTP